MVSLTPAAAEKLSGIMSEKGMLDTHALRVFVKGGGCGGMQYGMTFDQQREGDEVYEQHGLRVVVDSTSLFYIDGANIDYVDNLMGGGFHIDNPQAVSSCGCGSSFRTARTHDGQEVPEKSCGH
jgi:iron-sulfur cluster assembly protein